MCSGKKYLWDVGRNHSSLYHGYSVCTYVVRQYPMAFCASCPPTTCWKSLHLDGRSVTEHWGQLQNTGVSQTTLGSVKRTLGSVKRTLGSVREHWGQSENTGVSQRTLGSVREHWGQSETLGSVREHWGQSENTGVSQENTGVSQRHWGQSKHWGQSENTGVSQRTLGSVREHWGHSGSTCLPVMTDLCVLVARRQMCGAGSWHTRR